MAELKERVIEALKRASEPSLTGCSFSFGVQPQDQFRVVDPSQPVELNSLFRNELVRCFSIMTEEEFAKLQCSFKVGFDPATKKSSELKINRDQFKELKALESENTSADSDENKALKNTSLFKLAAKTSIDKYLENPRAEKKAVVKDSVKYQVLTKATAMVGIHRNKQKYAAGAGLPMKAYNQGAFDQSFGGGFKSKKMTCVSNFSKESSSFGMPMKKMSKPRMRAAMMQSNDSPLANLALGRGAPP